MPAPSTASPEVGRGPCRRDRRVSPRRRSAFALVCLVGAIALPSQRGRADEALGSSAAAVVVTKATAKCFSSVIFATGYIVPRATAVVMFNAPGFRLTTVSANEGDTIGAGQVVAAAAPVGSGASEARPGGGSAAAVPIKSLAPGFVLKRSAEPGMLTSANSAPLMTIAVKGEMEAAVDIPSIHVLEVDVGQTARIVFDDGEELPGRVRLTPSEIDQKTQVGQARIAILNDKTARVGRFVRVAIDSSRSCGIAVPRAALTHASDGVSVQVVKNDVVETRRVLLGTLDEADAYVASGVSVGDLVIADAGTSLRDGDRVRPIFADLQEAR